MDGKLGLVAFSQIGGSGKGIAFAVLDGIGDDLGSVNAVFQLAVGSQSNLNALVGMDLGCGNLDGAESGLGGIEGYIYIGRNGHGVGRCDAGGDVSIAAGGVDGKSGNG